MRAHGLLLAAAVATVAAAPAAGTCGLQYLTSNVDATQGVTYDVTSLSNTTFDWTWRDDFNMDANVQGHNFTFNICGNVVAPPAPCAMLPLAPAYQWYYRDSTPSGSGCYPLAGPVPSKPLLGPNINTALWDSDDPSLGFTVTYQPTNVNAAGCPGATRNFTQVFRCADQPLPPAGALSAGLETFIQEVSSCNYQVFSWSQAGCPAQCPVTNGALCSGAGICSWDSQLQSARCMCDDGYIHAGGDCSPVSNAFPGGAVAGATIGGILVGIAGIVAYAFFAARKAGGATTFSTDGFYSSA